MSPYSTALRLQNRRVDEVRLAIRLESETLAAALDGQRSLELAVQRERAIQQITFSTDAWAARMRREQARLIAEQQASDARLAQLRAQAAEAYGGKRAIEEAETRWRDAADAAEASAEQAEIDDLSAVRFMRTIRRRKEKA